MRNGIMFRIDPELHDFLVDIQLQRTILKTDKRKKSLTTISTLVLNILQQEKNLDKLLTKHIN